MSETPNPNFTIPVRPSGRNAGKAGANVQAPHTAVESVEENTVMHSSAALIKFANTPNYPPSQAQQNDPENDDAAYHRTALDARVAAEMVQRMPKRKRGGIFTTAEAGAKTETTSEEKIADDADTDGSQATDVDPSKEEWAANLRRVVFEPSSAMPKSKSNTSAQGVTPKVLTKSPAHVIYFPRSKPAEDEGASGAPCNN